MSKLKIAQKRLRKEAQKIRSSPPPFITALPTKNLLEWRFVIEGPPDSPFDGGFFQGKLTFPPQYPSKPPSIIMITPSGRFKVNTKICLSMSDFHPETWSPMWGVSSVLIGLLSFMTADEETTGSIVTTDKEKQQFAKDSYAFNCKDTLFCKLFPNILLKSRQKSENKSLLSSEEIIVDREGLADICISSDSEKKKISTGTPNSKLKIEEKKLKIHRKRIIDMDDL